MDLFDVVFRYRNVCKAAKQADAEDYPANHLSTLDLRLILSRKKSHKESDLGVSAYIFTPKYTEALAFGSVSDACQTRSW